MLRLYVIKLWVTEIRAIDPRDGQLKAWGGPHVPGRTIEEAREYCENNSLGYCEVVGELLSEIAQLSVVHACPPFEAGQRN